MSTEALLGILVVTPLSAATAWLVRAVIRHDGELSGVAARLNAIHEGVKDIKQDIRDMRDRER